MSRGEQNWPRLLEWVVLFILLPVGWFFYPIPAPKIVLVLIASRTCTLLLFRDSTFVRNQLWSIDSLKSFGRILVIRSVAIGLFLTGFLALHDSESLFRLPLERPAFWLLIILLYPILSAFPQELVYRTFFFHRYQGLFPSESAMVWASTLSFAFMHVIFKNPVAPLLTIPAGYLFATTYRHTRSLATTAIEHAVYGDLVFTIGLGAYFYTVR